MGKLHRSRFVPALPSTHGSSSMGMVAGSPQGDKSDGIDEQVDTSPEGEGGDRSDLEELDDLLEGVAGDLDVEDVVLDPKVAVWSLDRKSVADQEEDPEDDTEDVLVPRYSEPAGVCKRQSARSSFSVTITHGPTARLGDHCELSQPTVDLPSPLFRFHSSYLTWLFGRVSAQLGTVLRSNERDLPTLPILIASLNQLRKRDMHGWQVRSQSMLLPAFDILGLT